MYLDHTAGSLSIRAIWILACLLCGPRVAGGEESNPTGSTTKAASGAGKGTARMEFPVSSFDFGQIKQGDVVSHDFVFRNEGDGVLEVSEVQAGCGCTVIGNWDRRVEPGKRGVIPISFSSGGLSGNVHRSITVSSNDPMQPTRIVQFGADVWTPFLVTPTQLTFVVPRESKAELVQKVRVISRLTEPVALAGIKDVDANFRMRTNELKPGREFEIEVAVVPPFQSGASTRIEIRTSASAAPTITFIARIVVE